MPVGTLTVGITTTENVSSTNYVRDIERSVVKYDKISSPFFRFFAQQSGRIKNAVQPTYEWQEDQFEYGKFTVSTGIAAVGAGVAQTITINNPAVIVGDLYNEPNTNQQFIVTSIGSRTSTTSTFDVKQIPLANATTIVAGTPDFISMGTAMVEAGWFPDAIGSIPKVLSNIVGTVSKSVKISRTMALTDTYFGSKWEYDKEKVISQYRKDLERMFLFAKYTNEAAFAQTTPHGSTTNTLRVTRGVIPHLSTGVTTYGGTLTESIFDSFLDNQTFNPKYAGNKTKLGLCGKQAISDLNSQLKTKFRFISAGENKYGMDIQVYIFHGSRRIMLTEESEFWEPAKYQSAVMCVDPQNIFLRQMGPNFLEIIHSSHPQQDAEMISLVTRIGVECQMEQSHSLLTH